MDERHLARRAIIMGTAGRDFHNFNTYFRDNPSYEVVAFTAAQAPYTSSKAYPESLAGRRYPNGIPIHPEDQLENLLQSEGVNDVFFSYSDTSYDYLMHRASIAQAKGATFHLLGPADTMIKANKPVIAVVAVRTGAGKSTISRKVSDILVKHGLKPVVVRHPMPFNDFSAPFQRFEDPEEPGQLSRHRRGEGGVRGTLEPQPSRLHRSRLQGDHDGGREGRGRDNLGRGEQRLELLQA